MVTNNKYKEWESDFGEFLAVQEVQPPKIVTEKIYHLISNELNPSPWKVLIKLVAVVIVTGSASLFVCPQLGFGYEIFPLMSVFMKLGHLGCRLSCAAFFMTVSILSSCILLTTGELKVLRKMKFLYLSALSALGLGAFMCTSTDIIISAAIIWFIGAFIGGVVSLELGYLLRKRFVELYSI